VRIGNALVTGLLRSPLHRLLSGSVDVVRYTGRRSGRTITTPTQYARRGDQLIILVARADEKTWWRNFRDEHDLDVLVEGRWLAMVGHAVDGRTEPQEAGPLVEAYLRAHPRAAGALGPDDGRRAERAVLGSCRPRSAPGLTSPS